MNKPKKREKKLETIRKLVVNLSNRKSKMDETCLDICMDMHEQKQILKEVARLDREIDKNILNARKIFSPVLDDYSDGEICFILYIFATVYSTDMPRSVDSRDLELICRGKALQLCQVSDSIESGELYIHIKQTEMGRGNGWDFEIRSITVLNKWLMSD